MRPALPNPHLQASPPADRRGVRTLLLLLIAHGVALALLGFMLVHKHRSLLVELAISRAEIRVSSIQAAMAGATLSGLEPSEMVQVQRQLACLPGPDTGIAVASMFSVGKADLGASAASRIEYSTKASGPGSALTADALAALLRSDGRWMRTSLQAPALGTLIRDGGGQPLAGLLIELEPGPLGIQAARVEQEMVRNLVWVGAASGVALVLLFLIAQRRLARGGSFGRMMAAVLLPTIVASTLVAWQAKEQLAGNLQPAIDAKSAAVATELADKIERALKLGIPPEELAGTAEYFDEVLAAHPDLAHIRLVLSGASSERRRADGQAGSARAVAIHDGPSSIGEISVAPDQQFVGHSLRAIAADIAVVLLVTVLVFRELLTSLLGQQPISSKAPGAPASVQSVRLPLFLFILSEELTRAFLPMFFRDLAGGSGFSASAAASLPIAIYMVFFALTTPYAGGWADRHGPRPTFALGAILAAGGFLWMATTGHYWAGLCARALCATGYALATMACQRQIIVATTAESRVGGLALFVGAVSVAAICGSSIGGVLAERMGYRAVLWFSAGAALLGFLSFALSHRQASRGMPSGAQFRLGDLLPLLRNRRFALLMLGAAIPAKISLAGFLFYLTPLSLHDADYSPAAIGRAIMLYYILLAFSNPLASYCANRFRRPRILVVGGLLLIGGGGMAGLSGGLIPPDAAIWLCIIALGLGTGLSAAPMQALAVRLAPHGSETSALVALRTLERVGSVIGPLFAGLLLGWMPATGVMAAIGGLALVGAILLISLHSKSAIRAGPRETLA